MSTIYLPANIQTILSDFLSTEPPNVPTTAISVLAQFLHKPIAAETTYQPSFQINPAPTPEDEILIHTRQVNQEFLSLFDPKLYHIQTSDDIFEQRRLIEAYLQKSKQGTLVQKRMAEILWLPAIKKMNRGALDLLKKAEIAIHPHHVKELKEYALERGTHEMVQILIEKGVSFDQYDLFSAVMHDWKNDFQGHIITMIMATGVPFNPMHLSTAFYQRSPTGVRAALEAGAIPTPDMLEFAKVRHDETIQIREQDPRIADIDEAILALLKERAVSLAPIHPA